ncbi:class I adenylate-forming enzyme family protein [Pseudonocardia nigra]|uniref:class I adenylate-forming enzyme family protein n=1 Tax=Pseudonocardia nigra TaxID=1921578 RepID=UPI001C5FE7FC|nr:class I adenylate-forming enzyme family protein [Pseudonocardia nigra]
MTSTSIAESFLRTCRRSPDAPFLVGGDGQVMTYAEVRARARGVAAALGAAGVRANDRVVLSMPSGTDMLCDYLGALLHGCVVAVVDHRASPAHLQFVHRDVRASAWLAWAGHPAAGLLPGRLEVPQAGQDGPPAWLEGHTIDGPGDALVMYTSGTTGTPKGVRLTHENLRHTAASIETWAAVRADEVELTTLPLSHLFGLGHVHVHWSLGGTVVIEPGLQDIPRVLQRMAEHRVTSFPGTPAGFRRIMDDHPDEFRAAAVTLRYIVVNSAPMPEEDVRRLLDLVPHVRCYMYYGLTEASRSAVIHYNAHPDKIRTVGRAAPGTEVRVGTPERALVGEPGEILVRGGNVASSYWGRADSTEHVADGWFRTGDLGIVDADGFLTWIGRLSEQINVDGLKVAPAEVEAVLRAHPDVTDCAVAGAPDPLTGQCVVAFVVPRRPAEDRLGLEIRRHCRGRLESYKIPRRVEFVPTIPRTDTGKVKRRTLVGPDRG